MAESALVLRCMYGNLLSQPDIVNLSLHDDRTEFTYTQICYRNGSITLREQSDTNRTASDVAARLKVRGPIVQLESYVQETKIELPPSKYRSIDWDHGQLSLAQCTAQYRESILLRPGDTIDFRFLNVKIEIALPRHNEQTSSPWHSVEMATPSNESSVKSDHFARDGETDSDGENLEPPQFQLKKKAISMDRSPPGAVDQRDEADSSFHTQATQPLEVPTTAAHSNGTTMRSQEPPVDDEAIGVNEQHEVGEPQDNDAEDGTPFVAPVTAMRGLKRKLEARADQYEFPGDSDSTSPARRKRPNLPKAARESEEDGEDISSATPTATKKLNAVFQAVRTANGGPTDCDEPASSPTESARQSAVTQTSARHREDAEELEMADGEDEAATVTPSTNTANKGGRPKKAAVMDNEEAEDDEESTDAGDDEIAPAVQPDHPAKKRGRGRPPKASHVNDLDASTRSAAGTKKARKSLRSTKAAATPAKKVSRRQTATPSATVRRTPKILLSASNLLPAAKTWMTKNKIEMVDETPSKRTNFVCVVRDKILPSTLKVLRSLVAGKLVVCDSWINDSRKEGELLDTEDYIHADLKDIDADATTRRSLFAQKTLFFTVKAAQTYTDWQEVVKLAKEAGAVEVLAGTANKGHETKPKESVIFFGENAADDDAEDLIQTHGRVVYDKTALAKWIINADIDLENDEHVLTLPLQGSQAKKGGGGKKVKQ